eukprot:TRINITY_DN24161_c1_g1_i1.p1 TRINITY_DN24161_c1_g1~~TRINITY_DN24161_c1_g1_i1.p1  ORF type:complete len:105 (+),score=23.38 TRINITY_DN24161_c1_g1_i1:295-609(+)
MDRVTEEEEKRMAFCNCSCHNQEDEEMSVQFIDKETSDLLLDKFPDTSPYDFEYGQSDIWSPLVIPKASYEITAAKLLQQSKKKKKKKEGKKRRLKDKKETEKK